MLFDFFLFFFWREMKTMERLLSHLWTLQYWIDIVHQWKDFNIYNIIEKFVEIYPYFGKKIQFRVLKCLLLQVSLMSAQPGPYGQGQQYLPNPGSFVQNPAGTKQLTSFCFFRTVLFASGHKKLAFWFVVVYWVCVD